MGGGRALRDLWRKVQALGEAFSSVDAGTHASSIAYFTFLPLIPLIALCISLVSTVGIGQREAVEFFTSLVPDAFDELATSLVNDAFERSGVALSLSTVTLIWSASQGVRALHSSLNAACKVQETRNPPQAVQKSVSVAGGVTHGLMR